MNLRPYLAQMRGVIRVNFAYPARVWTGLLYGFFHIIPQVFVWRALYAGKDAVAGATLPEMLTYVVLSNLVGFVTWFNGASYIEQRMKDGSIGLDLLRPVSMRGLFVAANLGDVATSLVMYGLPQTLLAIVLVGGIVAPVSWEAFGLFLLTTLLGMGVQICWMLFLGTFSYWFINTWLMQWLLQASWKLLSGALVPLWLLPKWMLTIARLLPFQASQYTPVAVYLGRIPVSDVPRAILVQVGWIIGLLALHSLMWHRGIRRIVVLGG
ncbi:MAG: hypothetical protein GXY52_03390 [Chloroflexi bacterium]|nr:hypothetical protein [Chloroflexota bacterium]